MGGIDTLVNHELIEALPHRRPARTEIGLHLRAFLRLGSA
jgi:hypothetical protein